MTSKKATRRALFSSVIALILCCSMLVGTTFAWFTDEVQSMNNVITAGNLDIEAYVVESATDPGKELSSAGNLFQGVLWEPGHTQVVYLKVANEGSLTLKYQLQVNVLNETPGINKAEEEFLLSEHLVFKVVEIAESEVGTLDRAKAQEKAGTVMGLKDFNGETRTLDPKNGANDEDYVALIVYMPESVKNEANHNGTAPEITLGVHLFATQKDAESDSFGSDYDKDVIYTDFVVTNEAELKEALANAKDDAIIGIKGEVTWTTGAQHGSTPFIENVSTIAATSDPVKRITLLGMEDGAAFTAIGAGVGPIGIDGGTVIFKNLKIVDQSESYKESSWEFGYLEFRGNTVFENCDVVNAIMMEGDSATFKNCSFNSNKGSEYAVWVSNGNATFENCTFTGPRGLKMHEAYGSEVGTVVIHHNTFLDLSEKPGLAIGTVNADTTVVLTDNAFLGTQAGDQGLYSYETDTDVTTFNFTYEGNQIAAKDSTVPEGLYKDENGAYYATTSDSLEQCIEQIAEDTTVVLKADASVTSKYNNLTVGDKNATDASPVVTLDLDGNTLTTEGGWGGIVAYNNAVIKNGTINHTGTVAAIKAYSGAVIENVVINVVPREDKVIGGIVVQAGHTVESIKNVTITGATNGIEVMAGGSVGTIENVNIEATKNGLWLQSCTVGEVKNATIYGAECGVLGELKTAADLSVKLTECNVSGGNYGLYLCDQGGNTGSAKLSYDDTSVFTGSVKDMEFVFSQQDKLTVNGSVI